MMRLRRCKRRQYGRVGSRPERVRHSPGSVAVKAGRVAFAVESVSCRPARAEARSRGYDERSEPSYRRDVERSSTSQKTCAHISGGSPGSDLDIAHMSDTVVLVASLRESVTPSSHCKVIKGCLVSVWRLSAGVVEIREKERAVARRVVSLVQARAPAYSCRFGHPANPPVSPPTAELSSCAITIHTLE
jgi:hypothetical protein